MLTKIVFDEYETRIEVNCQFETGIYFDYETIIFKLIYYLL